MTNRELQSLVEELSVTYFRKPFLHQAYFNPRLRTTGGRYLLSSHHIEINKKYLEELGIEELIGIIKHELCHYHLHLEGRGYKHGDQDFKRLSQKVRAPRHCSTLPSVTHKRKTTYYEYKCSHCDQAYYRKRRVDTRRFVCGRCKGKLLLAQSIKSN
ncbi:hypothetical protein Q73_15585 [Bacillus coahuilensis m2-6]|uniref:Protein SprT-like n=1 Tax=Bacillus coahuilensis p1.1.43 TaxID=1150625 RepID=A0A147K5Q1_9BACI|nr:SprT family protein [Bacillus coahuilensis]KUP04460.1 hypothetical protein Q73_15585 [Bacillus coahuilensis m2-6]KUP05040.1 hypothetical protein Q75_13590 [Bacillus coahuilensis p1.1.43]